MKPVTPQRSSASARLPDRTRLLVTNATTAELKRVAAALVDALREAYGLARAGEYGEPLRDVLAFCRDLVAIAEATLASDPQAGEAAPGLALQMAEKLAALEALVSPMAGYR